MAIFRGGHDGPASTPPDRPETLIGLLYELSGDRDRTRRFIAIVCAPIVACCLGIALVIYVIMLAAKGLEFTPAYIPPAAILTGASLLTWITGRIRKMLKGPRGDSANGGKPTSKS
jgi:hypothetical protein